MTTFLTSIFFVLMCSSCSAYFTVTLPNTGNTVVGIGNKVKYNTNVLTNPATTVSGYDPSTGIFTVLSTTAGGAGAGAGVYSLSVSMMVDGTKPTHLTLRKGAEILVWLFAHQRFNMASQTINVNLVEGDQIFVQMNTGNELFDVYNTFSVAKVA
ncbi:uncharacterized protein LOC134697108 [Mytilus trossulus]|uniref:uncharacterized protein LOC134697108 n=1 Tax=Mytilus trossulus TaxID=6551 RepID=UPI003005D6F6